MEDILKMSNREIDRLKVIHAVIEKRLKQKQAARQLNLSARQIRRICKRVRRQGNKGIIHQLRGCASNHQLDPRLKEKAIKRVKERYPDFGPTFANEKLAVDGIHLSTNALRSLMIREGIWKSKPYRAFHRQWRERRSCIGELTQLDGSDHEWFEDRAPRCVLIDYIDDATSQILYMEFVDVEDTLTLMRTTKTYLKKYGRPIAFYVDRDSIYKTTRYPNLEEQLKNKQAQTQFERAMSELDIKIIPAYSPQAKGRVERSFKTHQDRLVKELRLRGISDKLTANQFLWSDYIPQHNAKFARTPANPTDAHRPLLKSHPLDSILSIQENRILANDYTLQYEKQIFQLEKEQIISLRPKNSITIEYRMDQSIHLRFKDRYLNFHKISSRPYRPLVKSHKLYPSSLTTSPSKPYTPPAFLRWRQYKNKFPADHFMHY
jgi:hypothetical protein